MGQAKLRGTLEERQKQGIEKERLWQLVREKRLQVAREKLINNPNAMYCAVMLGLIHNTVIKPCSPTTI